MAHQAGLKKKGRAGADYTLLLKRLEKSVLHSNETSGYSVTLKNKEIWENLDNEQKLKWASLAQIAGDIDTALAVYKELTLSAPTFENGWEEFLELLSILDKKKELAAEIARAGQYISKNLLKGWQSQLRNLSSVENENKKDLERSSAPFEKMIWQ
ncbi:MAG: hypothetical protein U9N77_00855, partial [Thermodesulfobacteriota bacterium]|nr:hypothetical protein [Thermodesulfobacteriota bacterium]